MFDVWFECKLPFKIFFQIHILHLGVNASLNKHKQLKIFVFNKKIIIIFNHVVHVLLFLKDLDLVDRNFNCKNGT